VLIASTWPSRIVPNGHRWSPPIFPNISRASAKYLVPIQGFARWLQHDESRQERMQQKRSTAWIFSTGVSGHAPIRGGALARGRDSERHCDRPFRPRSRRCSSNMNILLCTTLAAYYRRRGPHSRSVTFHRCSAMAQVSLSSCSALHCIIPDPADKEV
jgi:hypothetical protein